MITINFSKAAAMRSILLLIVVLCTLAGAGIGANIRGTGLGGGVPVAGAAALTLEHASVVTSASKAAAQTGVEPAKSASPGSPQAPTGTGFTYQGSLERRQPRKRQLRLRFHTL